MRRVLALISIPPPGLRPFIVFPASLVFTYAALLQVEPQLDALSLSPFVLAVVLAKSVSLASQIPSLARRPGIGTDGIKAAVAVIFVALGLLLLVHEPVWCQRSFTVILGLRAGFLANGLWRNSNDLRLLSGWTGEPDGFVRSWGRWKLVSMIMLLLINEATIMYGTLTEWVIVWSVAPVVAYCLMYWTLLATWDDEADLD
jgi:hypothetical protein